MDDAATVVLVHGAWHRSWCWEPVVAKLAAAGVPVVTVDLPSCGGPSGHDHGTMADDVAAVEAAVAAVGRPVVLVGHSRGGLVISEAGAHPGVAHLVYVAALLPDPEAALADQFVGGLEGPALTAQRPTEDGLFAFAPEQAVDALYHQVEPALAREAVERLVPMSHAPGETRPPAEAWRHRPSTFVVCAEDRILAPEQQRRWAARTTDAVEWDSDHSPMLSHPDELADLLAALAARTG